MDGQWQAGVGDRIRMEAERKALQYLVRMSIMYPDEWEKTRALARKWHLLSDYESRLLKTYRRLTRKYASSH